MASQNATGRIKQRLRTRKDLLLAAGRLLKQGRTPTMDEVAAEAMVSRATAYRYFPNVEAMLVEAPIEGVVPDPGAIFAADASTDPVQRIDKAEAALHEMVYRNEAQLRLMLAASLERIARQGGSTAEAGSRATKDRKLRDEARDKIPVRQNRRGALIEAALAPARDRLTKAAYQRLTAALSLIFGIESMIVFADVLGMDARAARKVKSWAARTLVQAALDESASQRR